MTKFLLACLILFYSSNIFAQENDCELLKAASNAYCINDYQTAVDFLIKFRENYKEHLLIEEVNYKIVELYCDLKDYEKAKKEIEYVLSLNFKEVEDYLDRDTTCQEYFNIKTDNCWKIVYRSYENNFKYNTIYRFYKIYLEEKNYNKALEYLLLAKKTPNYHMCGFSVMIQHDENLNNLVDLYLKLGKTDSAIYALLPIVFNEAYFGQYQLHDLAISLLKKYYDINDIRKKLDISIENLIVENIKSDLESSRTEYSIQFLNQKINLSIGNNNPSTYSKSTLQRILKLSYFYTELNK